MTLELGRQTDLEVTDQLRREVEVDRFTRVDRMLIAEQEATSEFADLRPDHDTLETMKRNRALLIARARRLEKMGLATEVRPANGTSPTAPKVLCVHSASAKTSSSRCTGRWTGTTSTRRAAYPNWRFIGTSCANGSPAGCWRATSPATAMATGCSL